MYFCKSGFTASLAKASDSNSFRGNQNYSDICIRANANHSEKRFIPHLMKNGKKLIRLNPRQLSEPIRNQASNPNRSEAKLIQTEFSIRINPNHSYLGFIRIESSVWIDFFLPFFIKRVTKRFSDSFGITNIGMNRNRVLDNLQNFSEYNAEHLEKINGSFTFYSKNVCKFFQNFVPYMPTCIPNSWTVLQTSLNYFFFVYRQFWIVLE